MTYAEMLQEMFPDLDPRLDDLFLLEAHQIASLPERAPAQALAAVIHAHPRIARYFISRHPPIEEFLQQLLTANDPARNEAPAHCEQALLWEIADWIVYQRDPADYDTRVEVNWDLAAVTEVVALEGKVVIDAGAGTGRVAFSAVPIARHVFAVEPVAALRRYMRQKAAKLSVDNLYVLDGFLHAIPLPTDTADVLLTCQAIGWDLPSELLEIERVVRPGGLAMHLFATPQADNPLHQPLVDHGYQPGIFEDDNLHIRRYWKHIAP